MSHRAYQNDSSFVSKNAVFTSIHKTVQAKLRKIQCSWLSEKEREIQSYADRHDSREILWYPHGAVWPLVLWVFTSTENRWHHSHHWKDQDAVQMGRVPWINTEQTIQHKSQSNWTGGHQPWVNIPPQESKIKKTIKWLSSSNAPEADALPVKVSKVHSISILHKLTKLSQSFAQGSDPQGAWGCLHHRPLQGERKMPRLWQVQRYLLALCGREDPCQSYIESAHCLFGTGPSPRESVQF